MGQDFESRILIIGAGCFGLSTAYHLLRRGYKNVTVIDKAENLPAADAASTDINKIVRSAYPDLFYAKLAREAIAAWKDRKAWGDAYHESGVYCDMQGGDSYVDKSYDNDIAQGARAEIVETPEAMRALFPTTASVAVPENVHGYINHDGGWAWATQGILCAMDHITARGGNIVPGKAVIELVQEGSKLTGVRCADGSSFYADIVVLAAGSWTASAFPDLGLDGQCLATGQTVCTIQLTPEEAEQYSACPVYLNFHTGFYVFPPTSENVVKCAIHSGGFVHKVKTADGDLCVSTPRTVLSDGSDGLRIPKAAVNTIRSELARIYPDLAKKPFAGTRLCWYTDSTNDDWLIGAHPSIENLVLATSGSGHAYKFLPVIGRLVVDAIEGKLSPEVAQKFATNRLHEHNAMEPKIRQVPPAELVLDELCEPEDLLPSVV